MHGRLTAPPDWAAYIHRIFAGLAIGCAKRTGLALLLIGKCLISWNPKGSGLPRGAWLLTLMGCIHAGHIHAYERTDKVYNYVSPAPPLQRHVADVCIARALAVSACTIPASV